MTWIEDKDADLINLDHVISIIKDDLGEGYTKSYIVKAYDRYEGHIIREFDDRENRDKFFHRLSCILLGIENE